MFDFILHVLSTTATTTALFAIIAFLSKTAFSERIKRAIQHEYETKLKLLDSELKRKNEIELSKLNNTLSMEIEVAKIKLRLLSQIKNTLHFFQWR